MCRRLPVTLAAVTTFGAIAAIAGASPAFAADAGDGPAPAAKAPAPGDYPGGQALITLQVKNGKVTGETGTAVPSSQRKPLGSAPGGTTYRCTVNFTKSRKRVGNRTSVSWFGGIGCSRSMFLFGESYLLESASRLDATGPHYQGTMESAKSGSSRTTVDSRNPSLYIRHLTNVYFPSSVTGTISVVPATGQKLNKASKCASVSSPGYTVGMQCDLYTDRF